MKSELVRSWDLTMNFSEYQSHYHREQAVTKKGNS